jgi:hypothetical protein
VSDVEKLVAALNPKFLDNVVGWIQDPGIQGNVRPVTFNQILLAIAQENATDPVNTAKILARKLALGRDLPGDKCYIGLGTCDMVAEAGGFDKHHRNPKFLGGPEDGPEVLLCPVHHRRIHSLIRAFIEHDSLHIHTVKRFRAAERELAESGFWAWVNQGKPANVNWEVSAAKVVGKVAA